ncbi:MAG: bifunctional hydroxymethylpyrimidine kinase/phosphomethylpyrimidine kinase [Acidimicrobiia bacterium]|nr:bifunctional hydroxymethylpyrimidine kinase/phosphomethylpyrimidine kinase [Acidimicrobiia bacterium]
MSTLDAVRAPVRAALTIAGSDSGGGAGVQADLKTFAAFGVYGTSAITAITAQNTLGVTAAMPLPADLVTAQIEAVASDIPLRATKTGMLGNAAIVEAVVAAIDALELPLVVVDPVMVAKSGDRLVDEDGVRVICSELLPRALVVTPNIPEAEALSGVTIRTLDDAREAARRIHAMGPSVIVKGGHAVGDDLVDLLFHDGVFVPFHTPRIKTLNTHGTGCTFASAVAALMALGHGLPEATGRAQAYVAGAIQHGLTIGRGHGPVDHFWQSHHLRPAGLY